MRGDERAGRVGPHPRSRDGRRGSCRACRVRTEHERQVQRLASRRHYERHRDELLVARRAYRADNRAAINAERRERRSAKREHARTIYRKWSGANRDKVAANARRWAVAHPEQRRTIAATKRARRRGARTEKVSPDVVYKRDGYICGLCGEPVAKSDASLDHIIPISRGGEHSYRNVQTAHRRCNSKKGAKIGGEIFLTEHQAWGVRF